MTKVNNMKWIAAMIGCGMIGSFTGDITRSFADNSQATSNILSDGVVIPYDGYLMLDSAPVNAQGQELEFALYESASGGTAQWVETQTVNVVNGRFSVALGKGTKLSASPTNATFSDVILDAQRLYIGIKVKDSGGQFIELAGRQAIEAAPFAAWSARSADFKVEGVLQPQNGIVMRDDTNISGVDQIIGYNDLKLSGSPTSGEGNLFIGNDGNVSIARSLSVGGNAVVTASATVMGPATMSDTLTVGSSITTTSTVNAGKFDGAYVPSYQTWSSQGEGAGGAAIYNDNSTYNGLMIVGNNSAGGRRKVRMYDDVYINDDLEVRGKYLNLENTMTRHTLPYRHDEGVYDTQVAASDAFCFLTAISFDHTAGDPDRMGCRLAVGSNGNWTLENEEGPSLASTQMSCQATCIRLK